MPQKKRPEPRSRKRSIAENFARDYREAIDVDRSFMDAEHWRRPKRLVKRMEKMERQSVDYWYWVSSQDENEDGWATHIYKFEEQRLPN